MKDSANLKLGSVKAPFLDGLRLRTKRDFRRKKSGGLE